MIHTLAHQGYLDGLEGKDPTSKSDEYELGWLAGYEDKELGKKLAPFCGPVEKLPVKRGDRVTIPRMTVIRYRGESKEAKRSYEVEVNDVDQGVPAYVDYCHFQEPTLVRPTVARVIWVGAGGYWSSCDLADVKF